jgi:hypothetical protein
VNCSLILVNENTSELNKVLNASLTPWDLLRVPKWDISLMVTDMNQVIKEKIMVTNLQPKTVTSFLPKRRVLESDIDIMVLPLSMDSIILEHVCLETKINQNVSYITQHKNGN